MLTLFRRKKRDPKELLLDALGEFSLPMFPHTIMRTMQVLRDPNSSSAAIARTVELTPGLIVAILKLVNSAAYGTRRRIDSVGQAVTLLGRARVESIVVAVAVKSRLPGADQPGFSSRSFWRAAFRRASLARNFAKVLHPQTSSEAFVAGLLQDMAVPLLAAARPSYAPLLQAWHGDAESRLQDLESSEFGWDHGDIGACVAEKWELPQGLTMAISAHHHCDVPVDPAIHLVSYIRETDASPGVDQLVEVCRDQYNLAPDDVTATVAGAFEEAEEVAALIG